MKVFCFFEPPEGSFVHLGFLGLSDSRLGLTRSFITFLNSGKKMLETIKKTMQTLGALAVVYKFTK